MAIIPQTVDLPDYEEELAMLKRMAEEKSALAKQQATDATVRPPTDLKRAAIDGIMAIAPMLMARAIVGEGYGTAITTGGAPAVNLIAQRQQEDALNQQKAAAMMYKQTAGELSALQQQQAQMQSLASKNAMEEEKLNTEAANEAALKQYEQEQTTERANNTAQFQLESAKIAADSREKVAEMKAQQPDAATRKLQQEAAAMGVTPEEYQRTLIEQKQADMAARQAKNERDQSADIIPNVLDSEGKPIKVVNPELRKVAQKTTAEVSKMASYFDQVEKTENFGDLTGEGFAVTQMLQAMQYAAARGFTGSGAALSAGEAKMIESFLVAAKDLRDPGQIMEQMLLASPDPKVFARAAKKALIGGYTAQMEGIVGKKGIQIDPQSPFFAEPEKKPEVLLPDPKEAASMFAPAVGQAQASKSPFLSQQDRSELEALRAKRGQP